ncbi:caspase family protein [Plectonema radiosum NIES-515]|uniref:Caspase family protein n=1 Tax=Plectonema radiosum NIES-515 TaxID=2986073 RepID=A0ABT3B826_9CYAN|nr:caspase family protein [Plectonema radiosum]MCV3217489.1 caspase family protein [Plectonema radiosum NIES-515]
MTAQQLHVTNGSSLWALLIGIDEYLHFQKLSGCVNDVKAMRIYLINQLGVPENQIRVLTNQEATRTNILQTFKEFFIDNPDIQPGSQIFFHYSGHGSQMRNPKEPDGQNETLVPHDSRTPGVFDIPDKTLAALLDKLAERKGNNITVILDCCHSGSGTREPNLAQTRNVEPDNRIPPPDLDTGILEGAPRRGTGASGWAAEGITHVLLAGCRDHELSNEYFSPDEGNRVWHGALTYFTLQALGKITPNTTYAELYEQVAVKVNTEYPSQMPQCEGDRNRVIFGGVRVERDPFITVQKVEGNEVTLEAGLIHGLRKGTELALYPPQVQTKKDLPAVLTTVEVTSVSATTAKASIKEGAPIVSIPIFARGLITKQVYAGLHQTVALEADPGEENQKAIARLQAILDANLGSGSPYLKVLENRDQVADLRVKAVDGKLNIYNTTGEQLVVPEDIKDGGGDEIAVLHSLESIVRYRTLQHLVNEEPESELVGKVKLRLLRYDVTGADNSHMQELPTGAVGTGGEITLTFDPERKDSNRYVLEVINESSKHIYAHLLLLNPDYSIKLKYPQLGQKDAIEPNGGKLIIGLDNRKKPLNFTLPVGWDSCRDYLKVIVTTNPTDFKGLEQEKLNVQPPQRTRAASSSALGRLLDCVLSGKRFAGSDETEDLEDWATISLFVTVVRGFQTTTLNTPAGTISLNDKLTLIKPEGFQGEVTVTTWSQATRSISGNPSLKLPPGLDRFPDLFQPIGRSGTRSIDSSFGSSALVISFDVDETSRQSITRENPLRLELPTVANEQVADLLPIAFDGEDYLPVGYAVSANTVNVEKLPPSVTPTKRGIGRTIQLFVYKKMGRYTPQIGLRRAELVDGFFEYRDIQRNQFQPGDTVALFVHGFTADTRQMVETFAPFLRDEVFPYKHLLTWDYETFGTSVEENGAKLALALQQQCGFGPDDQITVHVYAHSMGSLVSRCMVELSGGHEFVDGLVMAGAPNRGTTLATLNQGLVYLLTVLINRASIIPPLGAINSLLEQLSQQGVGLKDLTVNSSIQERLNALKEPSNVPYLVLSGENRLSEEESNLLNRLAQKVLGQTLDSLFGEKNDVVIGLSSMRGVRGEAYPKLTIEVLDCDHFEYFQILQGREAVKRWVTSLSV